MAKLLIYRNKASINDRKSVEERSVEHFGNLLNCDRVTGNDTKEIEQFRRKGIEGRFILRGIIRDSTKGT